MPIYRITENNVLVGEYEADNVEVLPNGQIIISTKKNGVIGIFNQNCSCFSVDDFYVSEEKKFSDFVEKYANATKKKINEISNHFGDDMFFKYKSTEEAYKELRIIYGILLSFSDTLNLKK